MADLYMVLPSRKNACVFRLKTVRKIWQRLCRCDRSSSINRLLLEVWN